MVQRITESGHSERNSIPPYRQANIAMMYKTVHSMALVFLVGFFFVGSFVVVLML